MPSLTLHGMNSPNVAKVVIMLEECGLSYHTRHVAVFNQAQFTPEFLELNPLGKVLVLEDSLLGCPIAESGAILLWLAERQEDFLPTTQPERAEVLQWLMVQMANYGPMLGQLNHFRLALHSGGQPYAEGRYAATAERLYRILDDRLQRLEWIAGNAYSIADIAMHPWANYLEVHGFDPAKHPALVRWRETIASRPAVQRAYARLQVDFAKAVEESRKAATPQDLDRFFGRTGQMPAADFSRTTR